MKKIFFLMVFAHAFGAQAMDTINKIIKPYHEELVEASNKNNYERFLESYKNYEAVKAFVRGKLINLTKLSPSPAWNNERDSLMKTINILDDATQSFEILLKVEHTAFLHRCKNDIKMVNDISKHRAQWAEQQYGAVIDNIDFRELASTAQKNHSLTENDKVSESQMPSEVSTRRRKKCIMM